MATWQFDLYAEPTGWRRPEPTGDGFDAYTFDAQRICIALRKLTAALGPSRDLYASTISYGSEVGNRVDVMMDEHGVAELLFRMDASAPDQDFRRLMLELADELGFSFYSPELGKTIQATASAIEEALGQSVATSFVEEPRSALR